MKIIIDDKIPYIKEAAEKIADEAIYAPGKDFTRELVQDADALIIRTRTHCNRELLEGSKGKNNAAASSRTQKPATCPAPSPARSEERRVGKEC